MEIQVIGKFLSLSLILLAGVILTSGIIFSQKEGAAGKIKFQLLISSIASFIWAFCYGLIGFLSSVEVVHYVRMLGFFGILVFLFNDFCMVMDLAGIRSQINQGFKRLLPILLGADFIMYTGRKTDTFLVVNGYMTWIGNKCFARTFHTICFVTMAGIMAVLGIIAYRRYRYKRQKYFMVCFYIANLAMLSGTLLDTFLVLDYALPTSAFGAVICTTILWIGTFRLSAFDASIGSVYDKIYNVINVGIFIFNHSFQLVYVNPYGARITDQSQWNGKGMDDIFEVPKERVGLYFEAANADFSENFRIKARNSGVQCSGRINLVMDKYNEPYCYTMVVYDITKEINMLEELKAANATKEHFLTSMSHEIRTPINAVIGMNEMILRESTDKKVLEYASNIENSSGQLLSIVNDILDFTKIESGKFEVFNVSYDLRSLLNDSYNIVSKRAADKGLQLTMDAEPMIPSWLFGDEIRIRQIVLNILGNAIKYTDEGFIHWECNYSIIDDENINLILSVRDTGRGLKTTDQDFLFKSFTKLDEKKNQTIEGTGLGLSITKSLLDLMGGTISVESIYGVGSRFTVIIPQKISNAAPMGVITGRLQKTAEQELEHKSSLKAPDLKILVVDDVEMNLKVIRHLLKETEIQIETATSGQEALKKSKSTKYDIIFMDHMMPEMDGIECMNHIKAESELNQNTPFIVLTANAIVGAKEKYIHDGFHDYLSKPLDIRMLEKIISAYVNTNTPSA